MNKNRIGGVARQGERAMNREALVTKVCRRKSGGRAAKDRVLTRSGGGLMERVVSRANLMAALKRVVANKAAPASMG